MSYLDLRGDLSPASAPLDDENNDGGTRDYNDHRAVVEDSREDDVVVGRYGFKVFIVERCAGKYSCTSSCCFVCLPGDLQTQV